MPKLNVFFRGRSWLVSFIGIYTYAMTDDLQRLRENEGEENDKQDWKGWETEKKRENKTVLRQNLVDFHSSWMNWLIVSLASTKLTATASYDQPTTIWQFRGARSIFELLLYTPIIQLWITFYLVLHLTQSRHAQ